MEEHQFLFIMMMLAWIMAQVVSKKWVCVAWNILGCIAAITAISIKYG